MESLKLLVDRHKAKSKIKQSSPSPTPTNNNPSQHTQSQNIKKAILTKSQPQIKQQPKQITNITTVKPLTPEHKKHKKLPKGNFLQLLYDKQKRKSSSLTKAIFIGPLYSSKDFSFINSSLPKKNPLHNYSTYNIPPNKFKLETTYNSLNKSKDGSLNNKSVNTINFNVKDLPFSLNLSHDSFLWNKIKNTYQSPNKYNTNISIQMNNTPINNSARYQNMFSKNYNLLTPNNKIENQNTSLIHNTTSFKVNRDKGVATNNNMNKSTVIKPVNISHVIHSVNDDTKYKRGRQRGKTIEIDNGRNTNNPIIKRMQAFNHQLNLLNIPKHYLSNSPTMRNKVLSLLEKLNVSNGSINNDNYEQKDEECTNLSGYMFKQCITERNYNNPIQEEEDEDNLNVGTLDINKFNSISNDNESNVNKSEDNSSQMMQTRFRQENIIDLNGRKLERKGSLSPEITNNKTNDNKQELLLSPDLSSNKKTFHFKKFTFNNEDEDDFVNFDKNIPNKPHVSEKKINEDKKQIPFLYIKKKEKGFTRFTKPKGDKEDLSNLSSDVNDHTPRNKDININKEDTRGNLANIDISPIKGDNNKQKKTKEFIKKVPKTNIIPLDKDKKNIRSRIKIKTNDDIRVPINDLLYPEFSMSPLKGREPDYIDYPTSKQIKNLSRNYGNNNNDLKIKTQPELKTKKINLLKLTNKNAQPKNIVIHSKTKTISNIDNKLDNKLLYFGSIDKDLIYNPKLIGHSSFTDNDFKNFTQSIENSYESELSNQLSVKSKEVKLKKQSKIISRNDKNQIQTKIITITDDIKDSMNKLHDKPIVHSANQTKKIEISFDKQIYKKKINKDHNCSFSSFTKKKHIYESPNSSKHIDDDQKDLSQTDQINKKTGKIREKLISFGRPMNDNSQLGESFEKEVSNIQQQQCNIIKGRNKVKPKKYVLSQRSPERIPRLRITKNPTKDEEDQNNLNEESKDMIELLEDMKFCPKDESKDLGRSFNESKEELIVKDIHDTDGLTYSSVLASERSARNEIKKEKKKMIIGEDGELKEGGVRQLKENIIKIKLKDMNDSNTCDLQKENSFNKDKSKNKSMTEDGEIGEDFVEEQKLYQTKNEMKDKNIDNNKIKQKIKAPSTIEINLFENKKKDENISEESLGKKKEEVKIKNKENIEEELKGNTQEKGNEETLPMKMFKYQKEGNSEKPTYVNNTNVLSNGDKFNDKFIKQRVAKRKKIIPNKHHLPLENKKELIKFENTYSLLGDISPIHKSDTSITHKFHLEKDIFLKEQSLRGSDNNKQNENNMKKKEIKQNDNLKNTKESKDNFNKLEEVKTNKQSTQQVKEQQKNSNEIGNKLLTLIKDTNNEITNPAKQKEQKSLLNNEQIEENVGENRDEIIITKFKGKKEELVIREKKQISTNEDVQLEKNIKSKINNEHTELTQKVQMLNIDNKPIIKESKTEKTYKTKIPEKEKILTYSENSQLINKNKPLENNIEIKTDVEKPTSNITKTIGVDNQTNINEKEENSTTIKENITSINKISNEIQNQPKSTITGENLNQLTTETEIKYKEEDDDNKEVTKELKHQTIEKDERNNELSKKEPSVEGKKEYRQMEEYKNDLIADNNKIVQYVKNDKDKSNYENKEMNKQQHETVIKPFKQQIQSIMSQEEHSSPTKSPHLTEKFVKDNKVNRTENENIQENITSIENIKTTEGKPQRKKSEEKIQIIAEQNNIIPFPKENMLQDENDFNQEITNEKKQYQENKEQSSVEKQKTEETNEDKNLLLPVNFNNHQIYEETGNSTKDRINLEGNLNENIIKEPIFKSEKSIKIKEKDAENNKSLNQLGEKLVDKKEEFTTQNNIRVTLENERKKQEIFSDDKDIQKKDILNEPEQETIKNKNNEIQNTSKEKKDEINQIQYSESIKLSQSEQEPKINSEFNQQQTNTIDNNTHIIRPNENPIKNEHNTAEPIINIEKQKHETTNSNESKIIPQINSPKQLLKDQTKQMREQESQDENILQPNQDNLFEKIKENIKEVEYKIGVPETKENYTIHETEFLTTNIKPKNNSNTINIETVSKEEKQQEKDKLELYEKQEECIINKNEEEKFKLNSILNNNIDLKTSEPKVENELHKESSVINTEQFANEQHQINCKPHKFIQSNILFPKKEEHKENEQQSKVSDEQNVKDYDMIKEPPKITNLDEELNSENIENEKTETTKNNIITKESDFEHNSKINNINIEIPKDTKIMKEQHHELTEQQKQEENKLSKDTLIHAEKKETQLLNQEKNNDIQIKLIQDSEIINEKLPEERNNDNETNIYNNPTENELLTKESQVKEENTKIEKDNISLNNADSEIPISKKELLLSDINGDSYEKIITVKKIDLISEPKDSFVETLIIKEEIQVFIKENNNSSEICTYQNIQNKEQEEYLNINKETQKQEENKEEIIENILVNETNDKPKEQIILKNKEPSEEILPINNQEILIESYQEEKKESKDQIVEDNIKFLNQEAVPEINKDLQNNIMKNSKQFHNETKMNEQIKYTNNLNPVDLHKSLTEKTKEELNPPYSPSNHESSQNVQATKKEEIEFFNNINGDNFNSNQTEIITSENKRKSSEKELNNDGVEKEEILPQNEELPIELVNSEQEEIPQIVNEINKKSTNKNLIDTKEEEIVKEDSITEKKEELNEIISINDGKIQEIKENTNLINQEEYKEVDNREKQQEDIIIPNDKNKSFNNVNEAEEKLQEEVKEQAQEIERSENFEQFPVINYSKNDELNEVEVRIDIKDCQPREIEITTQLGINIESIPNKKLNEKEEEDNIEEFEDKQTFSNKNNFKELISIKKKQENQKENKDSIKEKQEIITIKNDNEQKELLVDNTEKEHKLIVSQNKEGNTKDIFIVNKITEKIKDIITEKENIKEPNFNTAEEGKGISEKNNEESKELIGKETIDEIPTNVVEETKEENEKKQQQNVVFNDSENVDEITRKQTTPKINETKIAENNEELIEPINNENVDEIMRHQNTPKINEMKMVENNEELIELINKEIVTNNINKQMNELNTLEHEEKLNINENKFSEEQKGSKKEIDKETKIIENKDKVNENIQTEFVSVGHKDNLNDILTNEQEENNNKELHFKNQIEKPITPIIDTAIQETSEIQIKEEPEEIIISEPTEEVINNQDLEILNKIIKFGGNKEKRKEIEIIKETITEENEGDIQTQNIENCKENYEDQIKLINSNRTQSIEEISKNLDVEHKTPIMKKNSFNSQELIEKENNEIHKAIIKEDIERTQEIILDKNNEEPKKIEINDNQEEQIIKNDIKEQSQEIPDNANKEEINSLNINNYKQELQDIDIIKNKEQQKVKIGKKNESTETVNCENLGEIKEIIEESEDKEQNIIIEEAIKNENLKRKEQMTIDKQDEPTKIYIHNNEEVITEIEIKQEIPNKYNINNTKEFDKGNNINENIKKEVLIESTKNNELSMNDNKEKVFNDEILEKKEEVQEEIKLQSKEKSEQINEICENENTEINEETKGKEIIIKGEEPKEYYQNLTKKETKANEILASYQEIQNNQLDSTESKENQLNKFSLINENVETPQTNEEFKGSSDSNNKELSEANIETKHLVLCKNIELDHRNKPEDTTKSEYTNIISPSETIYKEQLQIENNISENMNEFQKDPVISDNVNISCEEQTHKNDDRTSIDEKINNEMEQSPIGTTEIKEEIIANNDIENISNQQDSNVNKINEKFIEDQQTTSQGKDFKETQNLIQCENERIDNEMDSEHQKQNHIKEEIITTIKEELFEDKVDIKQQNMLLNNITSNKKEMSLEILPLNPELLNDTNIINNKNILDKPNFNENKGLTQDIFSGTNTENQSKENGVIKQEEIQSNSKLTEDKSILKTEINTDNEEKKTGQQLESYESQNYPKEKKQEKGTKEHEGNASLEKEPKQEKVKLIIQTNVKQDKKNETNNTIENIDMFKENNIITKNEFLENNKVINNTEFLEEKFGVEDNESLNENVKNENKEFLNEINTQNVQKEEKESPLNEKEIIEEGITIEKNETYKENEYIPRNCQTMEQVSSQEVPINVQDEINKETESLNEIKLKEKINRSEVIQSDKQKLIPETNQIIENQFPKVQEQYLELEMPKEIIPKEEIVVLEGKQELSKEIKQFETTNLSQTQNLPEVKNQLNKSPINEKNALSEGTQNNEKKNIPEDFIQIEKVFKDEDKESLPEPIKMEEQIFNNEFVYIEKNNSPQDKISTNNNIKEKQIKLNETVLIKENKPNENEKVLPIIVQFEGLNDSNNKNISFETSRNIPVENNQKDNNEANLTIPDNVLLTKNLPIENKDISQGNIHIENDQPLEEVQLLIEQEPRTENVLNENILSENKERIPEGIPQFKEETEINNSIDEISSKLNEKTIIPNNIIIESTELPITQIDLPNSEIKESSKNENILEFKEKDTDILSKEINGLIKDNEGLIHQQDKIILEEPEEIKKITTIDNNVNTNNEQKEINIKSESLGKQEMVKNEGTHVKNTSNEINNTEQQNIKHFDNLLAIKEKENLVYTERSIVRNDNLINNDIIENDNEFIDNLQEIKEQSQENDTENNDDNKIKTPKKPQLFETEKSFSSFKESNELNNILIENGEHNLNNLHESNEIIKVAPKEINTSELKESLNKNEILPQSKVNPIPISEYSKISEQLIDNTNKDENIPQFPPEFSNINNVNTKSKQSNQHIPLNNSNEQENVINNNIQTIYLNHESIPQETNIGHLEEPSSQIQQILPPSLNKHSTLLIPLEVNETQTKEEIFIEQHNINEPIIKSQSSNTEKISQTKPTQKLFPQKELTTPENADITDLDEGKAFIPSNEVNPNTRHSLKEIPSLQIKSSTSFTNIPILNSSLTQIQQHQQEDIKEGNNNLNAIPITINRPSRFTFDTHPNEEKDTQIHKSPLINPQNRKETNEEENYNKKDFDEETFLTQREEIKNLLDQPQIDQLSTFTKDQLNIIQIPKMDPSEISSINKTTNKPEYDTFTLSPIYKPKTAINIDTAFDLEKIESNQYEKELINFTSHRQNKPKTLASHRYEEIQEKSDENEDAQTNEVQLLPQTKQSSTIRVRNKPNQKEMTSLLSNQDEQYIINPHEILTHEPETKQVITSLLFTDIDQHKKQSNDSITKSQQNTPRNVINADNYKYEDFPPKESHFKQIIPQLHKQPQISNETIESNKGSIKSYIPLKEDKETQTNEDYSHHHKNRSSLSSNKKEHICFFNKGVQREQDKHRIFPSDSVLISPINTINSISSIEENLDKESSIFMNRLKKPKKNIHKKSSTDNNINNNTSSNNNKTNNNISSINIHTSTQGVQTNIQNNIQTTEQATQTDIPFTEEVQSFEHSHQININIPKDTSTYIDSYKHNKNIQISHQDDISILSTISKLQISNQQTFTQLIPKETKQKQTQIINPTLNNPNTTRPTVTSTQRKIKLIQPPKLKGQIIKPSKSKVTLKQPIVPSLKPPKLTRETSHRTIFDTSSIFDQSSDLLMDPTTYLNQTCNDILTDKYYSKGITHLKSKDNKSKQRIINTIDDLGNTSSLLNDSQFDKSIVSTEPNYPGRLTTFANQVKPTNLNKTFNQKQDFYYQPAHTERNIYTQYQRASNNNNAPRKTAFAMMSLPGKKLEEICNEKDEDEYFRIQRQQKPKLRKVKGNEISHQEIIMEIDEKEKKKENIKNDNNNNNVGDTPCECAPDNDCIMF